MIVVQVTPIQPFGLTSHLEGEPCYDKCRLNDVLGGMFPCGVVTDEQMVPDNKPHIGTIEGQE